MGGIDIFCIWRQFLWQNFFWKKWSVLGPPEYEEAIVGCKICFWVEINELVEFAGKYFLKIIRLFLDFRSNAADFNGYHSR